MRGVMEGGVEGAGGKGLADEKESHRAQEPDVDLDAGASGAREQGDAVADEADRMNVDPPVQSAGVGGAGGGQESDTEDDELEIDEDGDSGNEEGEDEGQEWKGGEAEEQDERQDAHGDGAGGGDVVGGGGEGVARAEEIAEWTQRWKAFLIERGQPVLKQTPTISGKPVDIFGLYHETTQRS